MERFVIRKRKPDESAGGETSVDKTSVPGPSGSDQRTESSTRVPQNVEEDKQKKKIRKYNSEWEENYFVSEHKGKSMCLICRHEFADNKKYNVESHFKNQHSEMNVKFLPLSEKRSAEILRLKIALESEQKVMKNIFSANHLVTRASYEVAFNIAKHGKSYADGEFYKQLIQTTVATLCENSDDKLKAPLLDKLKTLSLSHQTISRRVIDIGTEIEAKLKSDLEECEAFSVALDETTDISDISQLIFWVRYIKNGQIEENIIALVPLTEQTRAKDIFDAFMTVVARFDLDLRKLVSVCTDGAPQMIGIHAGFAVLVKNHIEEHFNTPLFVAYHCIIHQENLCAQALEQDCDVLKTVTKVCKVTAANKLIFVYIILIIFSFLCRSSIQSEAVNCVTVDSNC